MLRCYMHISRLGIQSWHWVLSWALAEAFDRVVAVKYLTCFLKKYLSATAKYSHRDNGEIWLKVLQEKPGGFCPAEKIFAWWRCLQHPEEELNLLHRKLIWLHLLVSVQEWHFSFFWEKFWNTQLFCKHPPSAPLPKKALNTTTHKKKVKRKMHASLPWN